MDEKRKLKYGIEIIIAVVLSATAVATSWSSYQATRWSGVQAASYTTAGGLRVESSKSATAAGQLQMADIALFFNWMDAQVTERKRMAEFFRKRFRPEFNPAFEAWLAAKPFENPDAPSSPFMMAEYNPNKKVQAQNLEAQAEDAFRQGQAANEQSDKYVFNTVILSMAFFFAGITTQFHSLRVQGVLLVMALAFLATGLYLIAIYPVQ